MSDASTIAPKPVAPQTPDSFAQLWGSLACIAGLTALGLYGLYRGEGTMAATAAGALATALNAPSGLGKLISAAKGALGSRE